MELVDWPYWFSASQRYVPVSLPSTLIIRNLLLSVNLIFETQFFVFFLYSEYSDSLALLLRNLPVI